MEIVLIIVVIGAALLLFFVVARWIYAPRKNTRRLAMVVWTAFGPYQTAEAAEYSLRATCRVVLDSEGTNITDEWVKGVWGSEGAKITDEWVIEEIEKFWKYEALGFFEDVQKTFRKGYLPNAYGAAFNEAFEKVKSEYVG